MSSGLPWWTGAEDMTLGGYSAAPLQYRALTHLGDYVLFRGALSRVIAEGRFDENWQVPADAASRLAATGILTVR